VLEKTLGALGKWAAATRDDGSDTGLYFDNIEMQKQIGAGHIKAASITTGLLAAGYDILWLDDGWPSCAAFAGAPGVSAPGAGALYDASPLTAVIGACDSYAVEGVQRARQIEHTGFVRDGKQSVHNRWCSRSFLRKVLRFRPSHCAALDWLLAAAIMTTSSKGFSTARTSISCMPCGSRPSRSRK
jgi:hypothetical protein